MNRTAHIPLTDKENDNKSIILTSREIEYLSLVALGYKNLQIAQILSVSKSTVKKTLEKIFVKLKAKDRAHAVAIAFVHNIISEKIITNNIAIFKEKINTVNRNEIVKSYYIV